MLINSIVFAPTYLICSPSNKVSQRMYSIAAYIPVLANWHISDRESVVFRIIVESHLRRLALRRLVGGATKIFGKEKNCWYDAL